MRKALIGCVAATVLVIALAPASAQHRHWRGGHWHGDLWVPGIVFSVAPPMSGYYNAYAAEPTCEVVRERRVRPNGTVERRTVERCY
jgi:hypothetical protein